MPSLKAAPTEKNSPWFCWIWTASRRSIRRSAGALATIYSKPSPLVYVAACVPRPANFLPALVATAAALWLIAGGAEASTPPTSIRFDQLTLEDGLSQATITAILQDRYGFMWFGTQDGLNRYDGQRFTLFKPIAGRSTSLPHSAVASLLEDTEGALWVGTDGGGLARLNRNSETFTVFQSDPGNPDSLSNNRIQALAEGPDGELWVATVTSGLNRLDKTTGLAERFAHDPSAPTTSLSSDRLHDLLIDRDGVLWVATDGGGLNRFDAETQSFVHYRHDPQDSSSVSSDDVRTVYQDQKGDLWVGTNGAGVNRLNRETGRFERYQHSPSDPHSLSEDRARTIYQTREGVLYVGTDGGLNAWNSQSQGFQRFRHDSVNRHSLSADRVMSVYQDRGGVTWVGTNRGLSRWNSTIGSFPHYKRDSTAATPLSSNTVQALAQDPDGTVWIGTLGGGLNRWNRRRDTYTHYRHEPGNPKSLSGNRVMSLLVDRQNNLWVGTLAGGLNRFHRDTDTFTRFQHDPQNLQSLGANGVTCILEDIAGGLWIGTFGGGLNRFDPEVQAFFRYVNEPENSASLSHDRVMALHQDGAGILWIGTEGGGLNRFDPRRGIFSNYRHDPSDASSLSSDVVWSIHEDKTGILWIATQGGGLNRWAPSDRAAHRGTFRRYTEADGLPNNDVYGVLEDSDGHLWLSTNRGLSKFNPRSESFKSYDTSRGLQSEDFNFGAYYQGLRGEMFFGGTNGFNAFYPDQIKDNPHLPPVQLTGFLKFNQPAVLDTSLAELRDIELSHEDSVITFEFAAMDFTSPKNNRYSYRLENFDLDWTDVGNISRATYTNLAAGTYVFRVKGSNNDGLWNADGLAINLKVIPPPWRTWWAYSLYALGLVGLLYAYTRQQAMKLEREAEYSRKLEEEVADRTRELENRNEQMEVANKNLEEASLTDSLTGVRNRRYVVQYIQNDVAVMERYYRQLTLGDTPERSSPDVQLLMIDLDGFKQVNDRFGHSAGDRVLLQARDLLESACRTSDALIRWGGDEFLVMGRDATHANMQELATRIKNSIGSHEFVLGKGLPTLQLTCSIGFATYPFIGVYPISLDWEQVLAIADRALYAAKASGRDAWVGIFSTDKTPSDRDLAQQIKDTADQMIAEGLIACRSSLALEDLRWE